MTGWWLIVLVLLAALAALVFVIRWRNPDLAPHRITPPARRILFPFIGDSISKPTLDAALRLARAEGATLVPAYVMTVPLNLDLQAPPLERCGQAMPLLDLIEQRAARLKVPVDSRIEVGRTARHALQELLEAERFDRIVVPAATQSSEGFAGTDIAWLLEHAPGEIVVLRPETGQDGRNGHKPQELGGVGSLRDRTVRATSQASSSELVGSPDGRASH
jgi:nucleotide-binding universal stress UspA family protein